MRGGTHKFQGLHSDLGPSRVPVLQRQWSPAPKVAVNCAVEDVSWQNGPMRVVPRRKVLTEQDHPPDFLDEPVAAELGTRTARHNAGRGRGLGLVTGHTPWQAGSRPHRPPCTRLSIT